MHKDGSTAEKNKSPGPIRGRGHSCLTPGVYRMISDGLQRRALHSASIVSVETLSLRFKRESVPPPIIRSWIKDVYVRRRFSRVFSSGKKSIIHQTPLYTNIWSYHIPKWEICQALIKVYRLHKNNSNICICIRWNNSNNCIDSIPLLDYNSNCQGAIKAPDAEPWQVHRGNRNPNRGKTPLARIARGRGAKC